MDKRDQALLALGEELRDGGYRFTTITPASHARVNARPDLCVNPLRRAFGWSQSFAAHELPVSMLNYLDAAEALAADGERLRSLVRFSSLGDQLLVHSAFPTLETDAVFFGPDTYRFARALRAAANKTWVRPIRIADIGCGSGAGGLHLAPLLRHAEPLIVLSDINERALRYARINAQLNGVRNVTVVHSDVYANVPEADFIISNPPYLADAPGRTYRDGGGTLGIDLSLRIVREGLARLRPGGRLFLYTGAPIIEGRDIFFESVREKFDRGNFVYSYEELDPDIFGEELEHAPYDRADRIAVVALTIDAFGRNR